MSTKMSTTPSSALLHALTLIDAAHALDPNQHVTPAGPVPYELHYAHRSTYYLEKHTASPSPTLQLAVRAQHLRRWEVPRASYPMNRAGYLSWRAGLKKRMSAQAEELCREAGLEVEVCARVGCLVRKEGLGKGGGSGEEEAQALEDVACLVFLDDQFETFKEEHDEDKILSILRKTWGKMGKRGRDLALEIGMDGRAAELVKKALES